MSEKELDNSKGIVLWGDHSLSIQRSKLISRGREIADLLYKVALTVIRDIIVEIDKDGGLRKHAILDPVNIEDKQITEVFLEYVLNERKLPPEWDKPKDIRIGDTVIIERPFTDWWISIKKVVKEKRTGNEKIFTIPDRCPDCGSKIETPQTEFGYRCTGTACPGRIKAQVMAFFSSMSIYLNPELVKELVDKKMVWDPADLYFLKKEELMQLDKMDEDSSQHLLDAIEKSRHPKLVDIIPALLSTGDFRNWEHLGFTLAVLHCNSINDLFDADVIARIISKLRDPFIKPNDIKKVRKLMQDSKTLRFIEKLKRGGVVFPRKTG